MKYRIAFVASCVALSLLLGTSNAQTPTVTVRPSKDQITTVKTAPGITTRLVFPEPVSEIICGDLYDATSGRGSFVIQRGGKDVFLKPVTTKGLSNMFVKIGQDDDSVYSFDLLIVAADQAYRIVNVLNPQPVAVKTKASTAAVRIPPPLMPSLGGIDWRTPTQPNGVELDTYSLPVSQDVPEPPTLQRVSASASLQSSTRVPIQGEPTRRVKPDYPQFAVAAGLKGEVVVEIIVDEKGKVISAKAISGPPLLRQSAVNAALSWRYTPTTLNGSPTQAVGTINFRFEQSAADRDGKVRANR